MTIVDKIKLTLKSLGGVASLSEIYKTFKLINKDNLSIPQPSIRARIYEHCETLDAYRGKDIFGSI